VPAFADLLNRGLPVFADGLFYACERLEWYASLESSQARGVDIDLARKAVEPLRPFARWVHRKRPVLSYTGLDPMKPGNEIADNVPDGALDLEIWLKT
jgi:hypothetical protein